MKRSRSSSVLVTLAGAVFGPLLMIACGPPPEATAPPAATSTAPAPSVSASQAATAAPARADGSGPDGETLRITATGLEIVSRSGATRAVPSTDLHPPPGDRALSAIPITQARYLDDGTLLAGLADGTLSALDGSGRRLWSLGFRGAIGALEPAGPGLVAVTTDLGVLGLVTSAGKLRWERHVTAESLSPARVAKDGTILVASHRGVFAFSAAGEPLFSHASPIVQSWCPRTLEGCRDYSAPSLSLEGDEVVAGMSKQTLRFRLGDRHPAVPGLAPTFPLTFRRVLSDSIVSLLSEGPSSVLALTTKWKEKNEYDWGLDDYYDVVRIEGSKTTRFPVPHSAARDEVFEKKSSKRRATFFIDGLVSGPEGRPWVLARRYSMERTIGGDGMMIQFGGAGQILEVTGTRLNERNDLFKVFHDHWLSDPIAAVPAGTAKLFCFGIESPVCAVYDGPKARLLTPPSNILSAAAVGGAVWVLDHDGEVFRLNDDGKGMSVVTQPPGSILRALAGASEKDVWAEYGKRYALLRYDGSDWAEVAVPATADRLSARAADDVWGGRIHWDGKTWSIVHGAPPATAILAAGKDDVWLGDEFGLWHGTAPGPSPARLPQATWASDGAAPAGAPIDLGPKDTSYSAARATIEVAKDTPLTAARAASAAADGTLWLQAWDRIVEVDDGGKGTTVRRAGKDAVGRIAFPEAKRRGILLHRDEARGLEDRDEVRSFDGTGETALDVQLDHHDVVAVHGDAGGSMWIVGRPAVLERGSRFWVAPKWRRKEGLSMWQEHAAHALVRPAKDASFQPVLGLPSAAWCDVAATPDGGAWLAGALGDGPAGEGILFRAKGRLGAETAVRYRAPAALLAVASTGNDEAWAVGAGGVVVHVKGTSVTTHSLPSGEWLRAVLAVGPDDVWIGGDGGTLLHWDGRAFRPVDHPLDAHAAFTSIAAARGAVWAVSPSGILQITKKP